MSDFIPKQYKSEPITIRIDYDKLSRIDHAATVFRLSRSKFINQCIDYALEHMPTDIALTEQKRDGK